MIVDDLLEQVELGRENTFNGFSLGLPKLESFIDGVTQGTYTLIFSPTGTGKTTLALYSYIYKPLQEHIDDDDYNIIYYSLEMPAKILFAKLLSIHIFYTYGIELSFKELLSRKKNYTLSDEYYEIVQECEPWLRKLEKHLTIYDKGLNADILNKTLTAEVLKYGTLSESPDKKRKIYTPNNPKRIILVIIDHLSLLMTNGRSKKEEMDLASSFLVAIRNTANISPIVIMQANRNASSMERRKEGLNNLRIDDTKDTGAPAQDSDIILSIFNPNREGLKKYRDYNIELLGNNFRSITILKNRYGESEIEIGCAFYGKTGVFAELPKPTEISDFSMYTNSNWLLSEDVHKINEEIQINNNEIDSSENNNKFVFGL